jgi:hypothetical protein
MIFHELYSSYFQAVSAMLEKALEGTLDRKTMEAIIREKTFSESSSQITQSLRSGKWPLITEDYSSVLTDSPTMPLTTLEKRWLKALLSDPKLQLFAPSMAGLEDVEPLYKPDTFLYYDRYTDGDPYGNAAYIAHFRTVLQGIQEKRSLSICYADGRDWEHTATCIPLKLEYSARDDKFRLVGITGNRQSIVNIARLRHVALSEPYILPEEIPQKEKKELLVQIRDEKNALRRAMLHFSSLEKETVRLSHTEYNMTLRYFPEDEADLLIQVLSFGPMLRVISPEQFVDKLKARVKTQKEIF